jgi:hypothetical protein
MRKGIRERVRRDRGKADGASDAVVLLRREDGARGRERSSELVLSRLGAGERFDGRVQTTAAVALACGDRLGELLADHVERAADLLLDRLERDRAAVWGE